MSKTIKNLRKYIKPSIKSDRIFVHFFNNPHMIDQSLLACCCSYCIGNECPSDCSTTCFLAGTNILTNKGIKQIETINNKDILLSYDFDNQKTVMSEIETIQIHKNVSQYLQLNKDIFVTPEHRFWINGSKWSRAEDIKIGDYLFNSRQQKIPVISKQTIHKVVTVYNLELKGKFHNYFAQDVLVHNWK